MAEVGARLLLPPPPHVHMALNPGSGPPVPGSGGPVAVDTKERLYLSTDAGLRLRPNARLLIESHPLNQRDVEIRTNSLGYRGPELGPKNATRVLFLGDSITFGDWLPEAETFVRRVEVLSRATATPLETVNAGAGGVGLADELAILLETGLRADPDVVVLDFYLNDIASSRGVRPIDPPSWLAFSSVVRHALHVYVTRVPPPSRDGMSPREKRAMNERLAWLREIRRDFPAAEGPVLASETAFNRIIQKRISDWGAAWSRRAWRSLEPLFRELRRQMDAHGFRLLIVVFPVRLQVEADFVYDQPQQWLREIAAELDVPVLDLLPRFRELHRRTDAPLFHDHCHPTSYGNERVAEWVHDFVQAQR